MGGTYSAVVPLWWDVFCCAASALLAYCFAVLGADGSSFVAQDTYMTFNALPYLSLRSNRSFDELRN